MRTDLESIREKIHHVGLKASHQRISVLSYLLDCNYHPNAEEIFRGVRSIDPKMSRATIYNTLKTFSEVGLVRVLEFKDSENRYDVNPHDHAHFRCRSCGELFDIDMPRGFSEWPQLQGYVIDRQAVLLNGLCPEWSGHVVKSKK